jgi:hypothetical protein
MPSDTVQELTPRYTCENKDAVTAQFAQSMRCMESRKRLARVTNSDDNGFLQRHSA